MSCLCDPAPGSNVIMQELKKKNVKILSEKMLLLLNRGGKIPYVIFLLLHLSFLSTDIITNSLPRPLQTTLCVCSNMPRLHRTQCSSFCRMFSPAERPLTSSTALTWWWWLTSLFDKYLTFHLETRWDLDTPNSYRLFSGFKGIVSQFGKHSFSLSGRGLDEKIGTSLTDLLI